MTMRAETLESFEILRTTRVSSFGEGSNTFSRATESGFFVPKNPRFAEGFLCFDATLQPLCFPFDAAIMRKHHLLDVP